VGTSSRSDNLTRILVGATIGALLAYLVGIFAFRIAGRFGGVDGWEDLVSLVMSMMSFAPVGAIVGAAIAVRPHGASIWAGMARRRRIMTVSATIALVLAAGAIGTIRWDPMSGLFLAVWAIPVGAAAGYALGRRRGPPPVT
jgi:hypothetical protein